MAKLFNYLFAGVFCFAGLCVVMFWVFSVKVRNRFSISHPGEYVKWLNSRSSWKPFFGKEMVTLLEKLGDDEINKYSRKALFWFNCGASTILMVLLLMVIYLVIVGSN